MIETDPPSEQIARRGNWIEIDLQWCKSCSICVAFCAPKALSADEVGTPSLSFPEKCTGCGLCEMMCPDFAIEGFKNR